MKFWKNSPVHHAALLLSPAIAVGSRGSHTVGAIVLRYYNDGGATFYGDSVMNEEGGLVEGGAYQKFKLGNKSYKILCRPTYGSFTVLESGRIGAEQVRNG